MPADTVLFHDRYHKCTGPVKLPRKRTYTPGKLRSDCRFRAALGRFMSVHHFFTSAAVYYITGVLTAWSGDAFKEFLKARPQAEKFIAHIIRQEAPGRNKTGR